MASIKLEDPLLADTGNLPFVVEPEHSNALTFLTDLLDPLQRQTWSPLLPLPILGTLHAIKVTLDYRARIRRASGPRPPLLQGLFTVLTMALGGSTTSAFLMGIPPSWLSSNVALPTYALVYLAMFRAPGDIVFRTLDAIDPFIRPILLVADGLTRAHSQAGFAIESVRAMPVLKNSIIAQLLCGTLAGCGGGILADAFNLASHDWHFRTPTALKSEHYDLRVSFFTALTYALTTPYASDQLSAAGRILFTLYPEIEQQNMWLTLDPTEAKCLAGLLFATAQMWKLYSPMLLSDSGKKAHTQGGDKHRHHHGGSQPPKGAGASGDKPDTTLPTDEHEPSTATSTAVADQGGRGDGEDQSDHESVRKRGKNKSRKE
ncbi:hypothetical protein THASP1DRAFT_24221 [Thamnocephalis sphaerospora]|uniref:Uncharacterized protein n=1 Tax=Thamnocephalis sphaerospora TaxID=78915 RepID=A0A4P9XNV4_9FUNG|nr:hypothetical protein THASP1DRAFT_24221 [Thamnocephalis sphaerospora]|eukprot:RKP07673.1 hypothetical protein THASP1DRAFT_24221 [Thamnocephalis sphaerospora]